MTAVTPCAIYISILVTVDTTCAVIKRRTLGIGEYKYLLPEVLLIPTRNIFFTQSLLPFPRGATEIPWWPSFYGGRQQS